MVLLNLDQDDVQTILYALALAVLEAPTQDDVLELNDLIERIRAQPLKNITKRAVMVGAYGA